MKTSGVIFGLQLELNVGEFQKEAKEKLFLVENCVEFQSKLHRRPTSKKIFKQIKKNQKKRS